MHGYFDLLVCAVDCPPMEVSLQRIIRETAVGKPFTVTVSNVCVAYAVSFLYRLLSPVIRKLLLSSHLFYQGHCLVESITIATHHFSCFVSVSISHQPWCWLKDSQLVTVATKEPQPVTFSQKGFIVQLVSSHVTDLVSSF